MKKTVLTFVAVAFGTCVAFAQTTPETDQQQNTEQTEQTEQVEIDRMSDTSVQDEVGRRPIAVEELPEAVQRSLQAGEFKDWTVISAAELPASGTSQIDRENVSNTTVEGEGQDVNAEDAVSDDAATEDASGAEEAAVVYEIEFISTNNAQAGSDELEVTDATVEEGAEDATLAEDAAVAQEGAVKSTVVVVRFDQQGRMLSRTERSADDNNEQ